MTGSYAEYSVVPAAKLVKIPSDITFEQAATSMIQGMTAHYLVHSVYPVGPGTKVLVQAAAGGTGSLICQIAKNAGRGADKCWKKECEGSKTYTSKLSWIKSGAFHRVLWNHGSYFWQVWLSQNIHDQTK